MINETKALPGALSEHEMEKQFAPAPAYRASAGAPTVQHASVAEALWGGKMLALMSNAETTGRFAGGALDCPSTACTGTIELSADAASTSYRNADAIENIVCVSGCVEIAFGPKLEHVTVLKQFDMLSIPKQVKHQIRNAYSAESKVVCVLSIEPTGTFDAIFSSPRPASLDAAPLKDLGILFDNEVGAELSPEEMAGRTTRYDKLVPYKKDLNRTGGLPAEATESLSAGSVYPLIVPEGHIGRSRTAPMYGNQGLYMSIAECTAGDDGPPPHSHSDTQESFYVLDGSFDICTGFNNESVVQARPGDIFATPNNLMRTFRNTSGKPARLLVIIQGPARMADTVSFSRHIGEDFAKRFGADILDKYAEIRMTFDAEKRLGLEV